MRRRAGYIALVATAAIGIWMLVAPTVLGLTGAARLSHLIVGPIAASLAVIAMAASTRLVVRANVVLGVWLIVAPTMIDDGGGWAESVVAGLALIALALIPRGERHRFAGGWTALFDQTGTGRRPAGSGRRG